MGAALFQCAALDHHASRRPFCWMEEPALLAEDIRGWFRQFRKGPIAPDELLEARSLVLELQGDA
jgi:hypothetical protein